VVVPSKDDRRYTTRIVDENGSPLTDLYGLDLGDGITLAAATRPTATRSTPRLRTSRSASTSWSAGSPAASGR
jgi:hypothetical protein